MTVQHGGAEYIDDHTIEVNFVTKTTGSFGILRNALPWIEALSKVDDNDGSVRFESLNRCRYEFDDNGLIQKETMVSPKFQREIMGAILSLYLTTSKPMENDENDMESADSLTLFGYNAIVVIMVALISVMTIVICVLLSMQIYACRGAMFPRIKYGTVDVVTDSEISM